ncbi:MAG: HAD family phosphatase [Candidatus Celaenobacter antarcticus]|nr:HAD family phosphatase [Candidatus Celaenobacter antarcticus]
MPTQKYKALIFDLGNVIIDISPKNTCDYWAEICGIDPRELYVAFPFDETYAKFERGEISPDIFRAHVMKCLKIDLTKRNFDEGWEQILIQLRKNIPEMLQDLSKSFRIVALSNTNEIHVPMWLEMCKPILPYFEKIFPSNEIGYRKPEHNAYRFVLDYLQLSPEEIVFLDDNHENILAAEKVGMKVVQVESYYQMMKKLKKIGIM